ncbi:MAG TPA: SDR family oxidoreductase [Candidatus Paceibacterota bacterium]
MTILEKVYSTLKNKTAVITGGKRVGQTVARALAEQGVNIIATYRSSAAEAEAIVSLAKSLGVRAMAVQVDVSKQESVQSAVAEITKQFPEINFLVNMASIFKPNAIERVDETEWLENFGVHVLGFFWMVQQLLPYFPKGSHIVNITDRTYVGRKYKGYIPYQVTKGAAANLTEVLAVELAERGIHTHSIAPGPILRPPHIPEEEWQQVRKESPLKVPMTDDEAVQQFTMSVLRACTNTMTSGDTLLIDQGQNL